MVEGLLKAESILVLLSGVTLVIQVVAWKWVRGLANALSEADGRELISIISFLLGWTVILRIIGYTGLIYFGITGETAQVVILSVLTQIAFLFIVGVVWVRLRNFMGKG